jgi:hypothetical protein
MPLVGQVSVAVQCGVGVPEEQLRVRDVDAVHQVSRLLGGGILADPEGIGRPVGVELQLCEIRCQARVVRLELLGPLVVGECLVVAVLQDRDGAAFDQGTRRGWVQVVRAGEHPR